MHKFSSFTLTLCALFAALTAVFSWISVPIGPVPVNLALLAVLLCGGILGSKKAAAAIGVYILMGAVGIPVFASFTGGISRLLGPTGGFIVGYEFCAAIAGLRTCKGEIPGRKRLAVQMTLGVAACYFFGALWFAILRKAALWDTLSVCVIPFIPGDALKIVLAVILVPALDERIRKIKV